MHQGGEAVGRAKRKRERETERYTEEESMIETVSEREREREEQSGREHESRGISDWRRNAKYHCPLYIQEHNLTKLLAHSDLLPPRGRHRLVSHSRVRRRYFASSSLPSPRAFSPSEPPLRRLRRRRRCGAHDYSALISFFPLSQRAVPALTCTRLSRSHR